MSSRYLAQLALRGTLALGFAVLLAAAAGALYLHVRGEQLLSVQTASMVPTFRPGDALLVTPVETLSLSPGQVISYRDPANQRVIISHRLIAVDPHNGRLATAGDALGSSDQPFSSHLVVGRVRAVAPGLGLVLNWLHQPSSLVLVMYLPAVGVIGLERGESASITPNDSQHTGCMPTIGS